MRRKYLRLPGRKPKPPTAHKGIPTEEVHRLRAQGLSVRQIGERLGCKRPTVMHHLRKRLPRGRAR